MRYCDSCMAAIQWRRNVKTGRRAPIDFHPAEAGKGNVELVGDNEYEVLAGPRLLRAVEQGLELHTSHFTTCPDAERWRRG